MSNKKAGGKMLKSAEDLYDKLHDYIKKEGFIVDAKSFGQKSSSDNGYSEASPVANEWEYYVLVSITGFNNYLGRNKNYYNMYIDRLADKNKLEIDARVRGLLYEHNVKGMSIGHINVHAFKQWYAVTFERDERELTILDKRANIEIKQAQLSILKNQAKLLDNKVNSADAEEWNAETYQDYINAIEQSNKTLGDR